jgi:hypothetical protein
MVRFEFLMAVNMKIMIMWDIKQRNWIDGHPNF